MHCRCHTLGRRSGETATAGILVVVGDMVQEQETLSVKNRAMDTGFQTIRTIHCMSPEEDDVITIPRYDAGRSHNFGASLHLKALRRAKVGAQSLLF